MNYDSLHLEPGEHVILEVRRHWIVFAGYALSLLFAGLLPLVVFTVLGIFAPQYIPNMTLPGNTSALFLFFYALWLLFLWSAFFLQWTTYYLDAWFVTEKRIIDVSQKRIFDREISNLRFDKIEDVTIDVDGFVQTMLGFGNIKVETAGEDKDSFVLYAVADPDHVRQVIFSQHNEIGDVPIAHAKANTPTQ